MAGSSLLPRRRPPRWPIAAFSLAVSFLFHLAPAPLFVPSALSALPAGCSWGRMAVDFKLPSHEDEILAIGPSLRAAVAEHRVVCLRGADLHFGTPSQRAEAHVALARAIADGQGIEERLTDQSSSGHTSLFRVSNDPAEGARGVGTNGWHVDGTHKLSPQLMHSFQCVAAIESADTCFLPFDEFYSAQPSAVQKRWASLWVRTGRGCVHPFVHKHPITGRPALCLFMGSPLISFCRPRCEDPSHSVAAIKQGEVDHVDADEFHAEINAAIAAKAELVYHHKWSVGDVLIHDNLATAHVASPGTQQTREAAGLRILDRASVLSSLPLVSVNGGESSFMDIEERRSYLWKLWHSPVREMMSHEQRRGLVQECESVGLTLT